MAQDWIKMRVDLGAHPKIIRVATGIKSDRFRVIGGLHAVWSIFDAHSSDGILEGYSPEILDDLIGWPGFSAALIAVKWLDFDGSSLSMPEFEEHNGKSAKARAQDNKRKKIGKESGNNSGSEPENNRTREEKRREEVKEPHTPPAGQKSVAISLRAYLEKCKAADKKPIPADDSVFDYADKVGLPKDFLHLQWREFKDRYGMDGAKRYKAWPAVFGKSVRGNWFKLWYALPNGGFALTTVGQQAQRFQGDPT